MTSSDSRLRNGNKKSPCQLISRRHMSRCNSKIAYADWPTAERAALELMDDIRAGKLRIHKAGTVWAYPCGEHYHVGHQPKWRGSMYPKVRGTV